MARAVLTAAALRDVAVIADYTEANWGAPQAQLYLDALELKLVHLAAQPSLGRTRDELGEGVRSAVFESHILYFRRERAGILVLRIQHARQDPLSYID